MKSVQSGSALIVVMLISGIVISSITLLWRSLLLKQDIAYLREQAYCRMYSTHAFARLALSVCIKEYTTCYQMIGNNETLVLSCQSWPVTATLSYCAHVYAQPIQNGIALRTTMTHGQKLLHTVTCVIQPLENEQGDEHAQQRYRIVQWHDTFG